MIILVGSTRAAKVDGVRAAIAAIAALPGIGARFRDAVVEPIDVGDVAPAMPMTRAATIAGARARATAVLERRTKTDAATCWASASRAASIPRARTGCSNRGRSSPTERAGPAGAAARCCCRTPSVSAVAGGEELGDVVDRLAGAPIRGTRGAWGLVTQDLVGRSDAFKIAVIAALAPFYNPSLYR